MHIQLHLEDQSLPNCLNIISSHNAPSLTTLSSCPNPPMITTHRIFSKEGRDTKLGSPIQPKPEKVGLRPVSSWPLADRVSLPQTKEKVYFHPPIKPGVSRG